ncbi:MAG: hypothetical protein HYT94_02670 [Parcubacteria group bacterium]|nr:hypothetical protein [Parcubacteria group bacterium]
MMKQHSKKIASAFVSAAVVSSMLIPATLFAEEASATNGFCAKFPEFSAKATERVNEREAKFNAKRTEQLKKFSDNRAEVDAKVTELRAKADAERNAQAEKLRARATTPEQKAAVEIFVTTLHDAIAARRADVDAARGTFRTELDKIRTDRRSAVDAAVAAFKSSFTAALDKAKTDCAAGAASKTVRTQTVAALKSAKTALQTAIKGLEKNKTAIEALKTVRNNAFKKAQDDFKVIRDKARTDLKAAFPEA